MPDFSRFTLALSLVISACGGQSNSDGAGATSGTGGTSAAGGAGGMGGSGGTGGVGGSGGSLGGTGGTAGSNACGSLATLNPPDVGFQSAPQPGSYPVVAVTPTSIEVSAGTMQWVGPDLTSRFQVGDTVSVGTQNGWQYVAGGSYTAATYHDFGFVAQTDIPEVPYYGPHLTYAVQCSFEAGSGGCGEPPGTGLVYAVEATTGAGALVIPVGETKSLVGWDITNVGNGQYPGYSGSQCVVEAAFAGAITALGPALDPGG